MRSLAAHGIRPDTDLGQHFLLDENLVDLAVREAGVGPDDVVLEVGAGLGVLTVAARARGGARCTRWSSTGAWSPRWPTRWSGVGAT